MNIDEAVEVLQEHNRNAYPDLTSEAIDLVLQERERLRESIAVAAEIIGNTPEINTGNYDHDQVCSLNSAVNEVYNVLSKAPEGERNG